MKKTMLLLLLVSSASFSLSGQDAIATYLKNNAVRIDNPDQLNDSVYYLLSPYKIIMMGEMHGSNEPAQFVIGLSNLLTKKGDSVQVGLELPSGQMRLFLLSHTDSSIYQSDFFKNNPFPDGRQSYAWAELISTSNNNPKVQIFFFDLNMEDVSSIKKEDFSSISRDSLMFLKIKNQFKLHPGWKMITLSGNVHNSNSETSMTSYLKRDMELGLSSNICTLNHNYLSGTCRANFGNGLEETEIGREESVYDTALGFDKYLVLTSILSAYPYTGFYYTRKITAAEMTADK